MIACACGGIGELLIGLYLGGSLVIGWLLTKLRRKK